MDDIYSISITIIIMLLALIYVYIYLDNNKHNSNTSSDSNISSNVKNKIANQECNENQPNILLDNSEKNEIESHLYTYEQMQNLLAMTNENCDLYKRELEQLRQQDIELSNELSLAIQEKENYKNALEHSEQQKEDVLHRFTLIQEKRDEYKKQVETSEFQIAQLSYKICQMQQQLDKYKKCNEDREQFLDNFLVSDNLKVFPYIASLISDYKTLDLQYDINSLSWGNNKKRAEKVASLVEVRKKLKQTIYEYKNIQYQLDYLKVLYPGIDDVLETSYSDLKIAELSDIDTDPIRNYISSEEFHSLTETERNQLALDRYVESHAKSKWQVGRDYELYVGYVYSTHGYTIDYFGSYMGLDDLGRDLIAKRDNEILIIQCKYWSKEKTIHEKHIAQLYGTYISYCIENDLLESNVYPVFVTSTLLSDQAKRFCNYLNVKYKENYPLRDYPRIKCNIGTDEHGNKTYIYHLPMDQQYDKVKICNKGECMAFTVQEAEEKGFRRAYKWQGNSDTF